jgi:uncharacterized protein
MELTLERPGAHLFIRSVSAAGIEVEEGLYDGPLIISASQLIPDWSAAALAELTEAHFEPVFDLAPEIVLIGTGPDQLFPAPEFLMCFYRRNIGVECMTTRAACRTFNVLAGERRNVVAALLPPGPSPGDN